MLLLQGKNCYLMPSIKLDYMLLLAGAIHKKNNGAMPLFFILMRLILRKMLHRHFLIVVEPIKK